VGAGLLVGLLFPATALGARQLSVPLVDYVTEIRIFMPGDGSNGYVVPTSEERAAFTAAATALVAKGDVARAEQALAPYPWFEILDYRDGTGGAPYWVIAEKTPLARGWGFYFFARAASRDALIIEAPHPLADRDSELLAARAASELRPAAFLLAGAHRYADGGRASDMTHATYSIFQSMHEVVTTASRVAVQIHGFSSATHPGYPELLLSSGTTVPGPAAEQICTVVTDQGLGCTLFTGTAFAPLGAQTNVQGAFSRQAAGDGHFLHFETADTVRDEAPRGEIIIRALADHWPAPVGSHGCAHAATGRAALDWGWLIGYGVLWACRRWRPRRKA
jgi:hypothetical protein